MSLNLDTARSIIAGTRAHAADAGFKPMTVVVLDAGGHVLAVHWTGATDYPLTGREVHDRLQDHPGLRRLAHHEDEHFVLTSFELS